MFFQVHVDNDAANVSFTQGYSRKLRYMRKHQRVSLGFIKDGLDGTGGEVLRVDTDKNNSDLHTKPLGRVAFEKHREAMGVVQCL